MRLKSKNDLNTRVIQFGIYGIVTFSILTFGAVQVWAFSVVEMAVFFVVFLCILDWARTSSFTIRKDPAWILLLLFIVVVLMQLLPLPSPVLKFLSPSTYQLYQDTLPGYTNGNESADVVRKTAQEVTGVKLKESVTADRVAKA
ncbi:MAG: hypothetical protein JW902_16890, partial [Syntrophaceae bacterium]|nr:hypothetical protein [Syntrophaceae bacterium]